MRKFKKITECCDQWENVETYSLAETVDPSEFKQFINNCSSLDEFKDKVHGCIKNKVDSLCDAANKTNCDDLLNLMLLAALNNISIDNIVNSIVNCYSPELRLMTLESRVNKLYKLVVENDIKNERSTTEPHEGEMAAFDIATKFNKDDMDIDSSVDLKNRKDAWILRLIYNDGNKENLSMVKPDDNKDDYTIKSDKDKLNVKFTDDSDDGIQVPQTVIDHIAKHIEDAEENIEKEKKSDDSNLAQLIAFDIKKEFPNYDMEVIEGDVGDKKWTIEIVYKDGKKDHFTINKLGNSYIMKSSDMFIAKYSLDELKNFPKKLKSHIANHVQKSSK